MASDATGTRPPGGRPPRGLFEPCSYMIRRMSPRTWGRSETREKMFSIQRRSNPTANSCTRFPFLRNLDQSTTGAAQKSNINENWYRNRCYYCAYGGTARLQRISIHDRLKMNFFPTTSPCPKNDKYRSLSERTRSF